MKILSGSLLLAVSAIPPLGVGGAWQVTSHGLDETPQRVRLAPVDGDDFPDLLYVAGPLAMQTPNVLVVWRNTGNGRFQRHWNDAVTSELSPDGIPLEPADVNEDGITDLILANLNNALGFAVRLGDDSGTFDVQTAGPSFGGYAHDVTVTDYDDDGHLDVGTVTLDLGWYVDRFNGLGDGTFSSNLPFSTFSNGSDPVRLDSGDVTGDGLPDDVVARSLGLTLVGPLPDLLLSQPVAQAAIADLDGDGLGDIAATAPLENRVYVLISEGGGDFATPTTAATGRRPQALVPVDVDLDGDLDLAVTNSGARSVSLLENLGAGAFAPDALLDVGSGPVDIASADLDADGDFDLAVANAGDDSLSVLLNPLQ